MNQRARQRLKPTEWDSGWGGEGVAGGVLSSLDASDGAEGRWRGSLRPQPSIPKSSVNFFTFIRSSVLTVGRVVDRERSMSDCGGSRDLPVNLQLIATD